MPFVVFGSRPLDRRNATLPRRPYPFILLDRHPLTQLAHDLRRPPGRARADRGGACGPPLRLDHFFLVPQDPIFPPQPRDVMAMAEPHAQAEPIAERTFPPTADRTKA